MTNLYEASIGSVYKCINNAVHNIIIIIMT